MSCEIIEIIEHYMKDQYKITALAFVRFLLEKGLTFHKDTGVCWKDKNYFWVMKNDACVCYIAIKDPDEPENFWTVWSDEDDAYEADTVDAEIKQIAWQHIDFCGKCGSCGGGKEKIVFGKHFQHVCGCTFRIDNAVNEDLPFLEKIIEIRISDEDSQ